MDYSEDWCYFPEIAKRRLVPERQLTDLYSCNLIAVSNKFGYVVLGAGTLLYCLPSHSLRLFIEEESGDGVVCQDVGFPITFIRLSQSEEKVAVAGENQLVIQTAISLKNNASQRAQFEIPSCVQEVKWGIGSVGVLTIEKVLYFYTEEGLKSEKSSGVTAFHHSMQYFIYATESELLVEDRHTNKLIKQQPIEGLNVIGLKLLDEARLVVYNIRSEEPTLSLYSMPDLEEIASMDDPDFVAMCPPGSLANLQQSYFTTFFEFIPSRKTIIFSATCQPAVEVSFEHQDSFQLMLWDDRSEDKCKCPWTDDYEELVRGLALVTSITPGSSTYTHPLKDYEITIKYPPYLLVMGGDGVLSLRLFVDLRNDYKEHSLITEPESLVMSSPVVDTLAPIIEEHKATTPAFFSFGPASTPIKPDASLTQPRGEQSTRPVPPQAIPAARVEQKEEQKKPPELTPAQKEQKKLKEFGDEYLMKLDTKLQTVGKAMAAIGEQHTQTKESITRSSEALKQLAESLDLLNEPVDGLLNSHITSIQTLKNIEASMEKIQARLAHAKDESIDLRLATDVRMLNQQGGEIALTVRGLENAAKMYTDLTRTLQVAPEHTGLSRFQVCRSLARRPPSTPAPDINVQAVLEERLARLTRQVQHLEVNMLNLKNRLKPRQEKRFAFEDVETIDAGPSILDFEDISDIRLRFKDVCQHRKINAKPKKDHEQVPNLHVPLYTAESVGVPKIETKAIDMPVPKTHAGPSEHFEISEKISRVSGKVEEYKKKLTEARDGIKPVPDKPQSPKSSSDGDSNPDDPKQPPPSGAIIRQPKSTAGTPGFGSLFPTPAFKPPTTSSPFPPGAPGQVSGTVTQPASSFFLNPPTTGSSSNPKPPTTSSPFPPGAPGQASGTVTQPASSFFVNPPTTGSSFNPKPPTTSSPFPPGAPGQALGTVTQPASSFFVNPSATTPASTKPSSFFVTTTTAPAPTSSFAAANPTTSASSFFVTPPPTTTSAPAPATSFFVSTTAIPARTQPLGSQAGVTTTATPSIGTSIASGFPAASGFGSASAVPTTAPSFPATTTSSFPTGSAPAFPTTTAPSFLTGAAPAFPTTTAPSFPTGAAPAFPGATTAPTFGSSNPFGGGAPAVGSFGASAASFGNPTGFQPRPATGFTATPQSGFFAQAPQAQQSLLSLAQSGGAGGFGGHTSQFGTTSFAAPSIPRVPVTGGFGSAVAPTQGFSQLAGSASIQVPSTTGSANLPASFFQPRQA